jgi:hypothetical protein
LPDSGWETTPFRIEPMTYGILLAAALTALVMTISAAGSHPPKDDGTASWPALHLQKSDRHISDGK